MSVKIFDLDQYNVSFLGVPISGYGEGGAVKIEKVDPTYTHKVGQDGTVLRTKKGNNLHKITITVLQGSQANAYLSTVNNLDAASANGAGVGPFVAADSVQGTSLFVAGQAWIEGPPVQEFGNEAKDREWILYGNADVNFVGGN